METKLNINSIPDGALTFDKIQLLDSSSDISLSQYLTEWRHNHSYTVSMDFNNITYSDVEKIQTVASRSKVGWIELHDTSSEKSYTGRLLYNDEYSMYNLCDIYIEPTDKTGCYYRIQRSNKSGPITFSIVYKTIISTTYNNLKWWRDNSMLTPGQQYRITDYITTTSQEKTESGLHPFDIIVTADSENTLNEKARAVQHDGDTYFADSNLAAWEIWYCLDNDTDRFAWAKSGDRGGYTESLKHSFYYGLNAYEFGFYLTRAQWGDFVNKYDNTQYYAWEREDGVTATAALPYFYTKTPTITEYVPNSSVAVYEMVQMGSDRPPETYGYGPEQLMGYLHLENARILFDGGTGVIYRMIDEFGNDCPYDFKNIKTTALQSMVAEWPKNIYTWYTFSLFDDDEYNSPLDATVSNKSVRNITIKPYIVDGKQHLNNIILLPDANTGSTIIAENVEFDNNCRNIWGRSASNIKVGKNCYNICFVNIINGTIGNDGYDMKLMDSNTFSIGNNCYNIYHSAADRIVMNNSIIGDWCHNIRIYSLTDSTIGDKCETLYGTNCTNSTIGNQCSNLEMNILQNSTISDHCSDLTVSGHCTNMIFGYDCTRLNFSIIRDSIIGDGVKYLGYTGAQALQFIKIISGTCGGDSTTYKYMDYKNGSEGALVAIAKHPTTGEFIYYNEALAVPTSAYV